MPGPIQCLAVAVNFPPGDLEEALPPLRKAFPKVYSCLYPTPLPQEAFEEVEMLFVTGKGLPPNLSSLRQLPKLRHIQLASAGADKLLSSAIIQELKEEGGRGITIATAAGTHVASIPNWVVGQLIGVYHQFHRMHDIARNERRWTTGLQVDVRGKQYMARTMLGRTAGILGYGALGRETARLLKAHGMRVIAANTSGKATPQTGYRIPGTGDPDGSVPERYFSTDSPESLKAFLEECDVLVASLPSTARTTWLLDAEKLGTPLVIPPELLLMVGWMKPDAVFLNVGRGTLIKSEELLKALDSLTNPLLGAAIDVTDPEPLPADHPLWTHPRCIVTPHLSGDTEHEFRIATDIAIANAGLIAKGERLMNLVDLERGY